MLHFICVCAQFFQLCVTLWTVACQVLLSMGFSRPEYGSSLPCPSPGDLPHLQIKLRSPVSSALQVDSLSLSHWGNPTFYKMTCNYMFMVILPSL